MGRIRASALVAVVLGGFGLTVFAAPAAQAAPVPTPIRSIAVPVSSIPSGAVSQHACSQTVAVGRYACLAERRTDAGAKAFTQGVTPNGASPMVTPRGLAPADLVSAYGLPSTGSTATVAIVDAYDNPRAEADLAVYRTQYGLPACTTANGCFRKVNQRGASSPLPAADTGWAGEIALDLAMVSAVCPTCNLLLVEADDNGSGLYTSITTSVALGAKFVSMSWGGPESSWDPWFTSNYFNQSGVVFLAASGDSGYNSTADYPASSPNVVSVGGTSLTRSAAAGRGWAESVWRGSGSACSAVAAKPSYQSAIPSSVCAGRASNDIAAVADPATGVAVYQTYGASGWTVYGGTSAATPIIAGAWALAGATTSTNPIGGLYTHAASALDVTSGSNGTCSATLRCTAAAGWDGPTGIGTPYGLGVFAAGGSDGTQSGSGSSTGTGSAGGGGSSSTPAPAHTVTVTNPGRVSTKFNQAVSLPIRGSDSAGAALRYTATGLPTGTSINPANGVIGGRTTRGGQFTVRVTATDSTGANGSTTFAWAVAASPCVGRSTVRGTQSTLALTAGCHARLSVTVRFDSSTKVGRYLRLVVNNRTVVGQIYSRGGLQSAAFDLTRYRGQRISMRWVLVQSGHSYDVSKSMISTLSYSL